jgi:hypothetical protein
VARLHLGLILPNYGDVLEAERLAAVAVVAEEAGFDSGWVTDHLLVPPEHATVYGTIAESLVTLGFLAGRTRTLELGASALVVPQRNPLVALKQLTTLDLLSGGRALTAVVAGWMEDEFRDARRLVRGSRPAPRRVARHGGRGLPPDAGARSLGGRAAHVRMLAGAGPGPAGRTGAVGRGRLARDAAPRGEDGRLAPGRAPG